MKKTNGDLLIESVLELERLNRYEITDKEIQDKVDEIFTKEIDIKGIIKDSLKGIKLTI